MRDTRAKKDEHQREEDEAERLIRSQPKHKPPRRDRRRERVVVDRDPDTDSDSDLSGDPDLSLNYKSIGGSSPAERVKVRNTESDTVVMVSPETLKDQGGKYEKVEEKGGGDSVPPRSEDPATDLREIGKSNERVRGMIDILSNPQHPEYGTLTSPAILSRPIKDLKGFEGVGFPPGVVTIKDFHDLLQKQAPAPASGKKKEKEKEKAPEEEPPHALSALSTEKRKFLDSIVKQWRKDQEDQKKPKTIEEALGGIDPESLPEPFKSAILAERAKDKPKSDPESKDKPKSDPESKDKPKSDPESKDKPKSDPVPDPDSNPDSEPEEKSAPAPWPGRRKVDREEVSQAQSVIAKTLPAKLAVKMMGLHPDDAFRLASTYKGMKSLGPFKDESEFKSSMEHLKKGFTLDPESIAPPSTWRTSKGEVPFEKLSPKLQEKALSAHRTQVLGYSFAMRDRAIATLVQGGLTGSAAAHAVDLSLKKQPHPESSEDNRGFHERKRSKLRAVVQNQFVAAAANPSIGVMSKSVRAKAIQAASMLDEGAQAIGFASIQANDLKHISDQHLNGPNAISEKSSPRKIIAQVNTALDQFDQLAKDYPSQVRSTNADPKKVFRWKALTRLRAAASPRVFKEIEAFFSRQDNAEYAKKKVKFKADSARYSKDLSAYEAKFTAWQGRNKSEGGSPYRSAPPGPSAPPPVPPVEPEKPKAPRGYYEAMVRETTPSVRKSRNLIRNVERQLAADKPGTGLIRRLLDKAKSVGKKKGATLYSSYGYRDLIMGPTQTDRQAVYHGIEPEAGPSYEDWNAAHICELGPSDATLILANAREWLRSPILSKSIDGMPADARFRAALDLAIRGVEDGKYSAAVSDEAYRSLLSSLQAGKGLAAEARAFAASIAPFEPAVAYQLFDFADNPSQRQAAILRAALTRSASETPAMRSRLLPALHFITQSSD